MTSGDEHRERTTTVWAPATPPLQLEPADVHVRRFHVVAPGPDLVGLRALLTDEERARADRFYREQDRSTYTTGRGRLRTLLGAYLGCEPSGLRFRYGPRGKPCLDDERQDLRFNLSHSGDLVLVALGRGDDLGVDVERWRRGPVEDGIAERFFSSREVEELLEFRGEERVAAFFRCWSRKEALLKATGDGLALPLDQFDVSLEEIPEPPLRETRFDPSARERWRLWSLDPSPGYGGALAAPAGTTRIRTLDGDGLEVPGA